MSAAPTIFTLTGNLLWERTLEFAEWAPGRTQRAIRETFQVGGKGINVSKMLTRLGAPNRALCFTGGATGADCDEWLREHRFNFHSFATGLPTRIGIVVRGGPHSETTFFGPDTPPSAEAIRACADFLDAQLTGQILAVCGSLPGWNEPRYDALRAALDRWLQRGTLVADTYGPPLAWLASRPLALVKINAGEFRSLPGATSTPASTAEVLATARELWPVRQWIITDGPRPVWFRGETGAPASLVPSPVREISATGSGDVLFACVLHAHFAHGLSLRAALAAALPWAAANAVHPGIAEFPMPSEWPNSPRG